MPPTDPAPRDLWVCEWCGRRFVVPSLARDCEWKHEQE